MSSTKKKLPKKGSKEWQNTNIDSREVPKKWLHERWYHGKANPTTGEKLIITSQVTTQAYRDNYDAIFNPKPKKKKRKKKVTKDTE